ncbi:hypothetical protein GOP56_12415 [Brevibacillus sp. 7WMA2]|uniref:WxL domain-containing protein n=1 Tax=Brevibacillus laterosporus LMG 15441 TaxID=1042163 RepID=A0A075RG49_BRELA|nr:MULTISPECIES: hypothetical protein [Brevibacillus]WPS87212.1 hypothetical protein SMD22_22430 [Brevibacillus halotolerans]HAS00631.1 hypothetical protein [Brevibacillus sp.]AIG28235.1 hypothetical protein BRLA_c039520 [Brevibacillus laterosporus LMG 15441]AYK05478.1 hypothetical protein D8Z77_03110 [Brevibacillus laterosporus]ERM17203.1 hypothetical protein P615_21745 [Brevibacillus laterosporus PE36]
MKKQLILGMTVLACVFSASSAFAAEENATKSETMAPQTFFNVQVAPQTVAPASVVVPTEFTSDTTKGEVVNFSIFTPVSAPTQVTDTTTPATGIQSATKGEVFKSTVIFG